jgi:hypothetical protein
MPFQTSLNVEVDAALDGANVSLSGLDTAIDGVSTTLSGMLFREPVGGTAASITTSGAYTVCTLTARTPYEIRILPVTATGLAVGRYRVDGNQPDNDRDPIITSEDSPHTLYLREDGTYKIVKDSIYNADFTTTCYPTVR